MTSIWTELDQLGSLNSVSSISKQLDQAFQDLIDLNERLDGRQERRGECDKYIFKSGKRKCRREVDEQIAEIERLKIEKSDQIQQLQKDLQQAQNTASNNTSQPSGASTGSGGAIKSGGNTLMYVGLAALAAGSYWYSKRKQKNQ